MDSWKDCQKYHEPKVCSLAQIENLVILADKDFAALEEEDDSSAEELHALIEREKKDFISLDEYLKRRGIV